MGQVVRIIEHIFPNVYNEVGCTILKIVKI